MIFDELDLKTLNVFPVEIWLIVKNFFIKNVIRDTLQFPCIVTRRLNHEFFADHWQAYMRFYRWDIEISHMSESCLIQQYFKEKRVGIEWSGLNMLLRERVFGVGFNINQLFLESVFLDEDYDEFLPSLDDQEEHEFDLFYY